MGEIVLAVLVCSGQWWPVLVSGGQNWSIGVVFVGH